MSLDFIFHPICNMLTGEFLSWMWHNVVSTLQAKAAIREYLPGGLREAISKVRSSVAYAVSAIAHWDWPEAWPQLFTLLMEMLISGDINAVHGAMRVLTGMSWDKREHLSALNKIIQHLCLNNISCIVNDIQIWIVDLLLWDCKSMIGFNDLVQSDSYFHSHKTPSEYS